MTDPAIRLSELQAVIDPEAAARKELRARVEAGVLQISRQGLAGLMPPHLPIDLEGISGGRLQLRAEWKGIPAVVDLLPEGTPAGTLLLRPTGMRLAGFVPLPAEAVLGFIYSLVASKLPEARWVQNRMLEVDLQALARRIHLELPPLRRVAVEPWGVELQFG